MYLNSTRRQGGFSLLEALISAIVFSVGMLGLAGLQLAGMKSNYSAYLRSQATFAVSDLIDRMRANPAAFVDRNLKSDDDELAVSEFADWVGLVSDLLPAPEDEGVPSAEMNCTTANNDCGNGNCEITVSWNDSRGERISEAEVSSSSPIDFFFRTAVADEVIPERDAETLSFSVCFRLPESV